MNDICPVCRVLRDLDAKKKTVRRKDSKGNSIKVQITDYSCSTCGVFVKSEETKMRRDQKKRKSVKKKK